jgi:hypothetical protein
MFAAVATDIGRRFTDAEEKLFEVANEILMYRSHK